MWVTVWARCGETVVVWGRREGGDCFEYTAGTLWQCGDSDSVVGGVDGVLSGQGFG